MGCTSRATPIFRRACKPGDARYKDLDGNGIINDKDRAHVGRVFPKFTYGLNLNASYGNFDISAFFQGIQGNDVFNNTKYWLDRIDQTGNYRTDLNPWSPTNTGSTTPRLVAAGPSAANNARLNSTRWLEDGSYLRLKNLQIGYSLPSVAAGKGERDFAPADLCHRPECIYRHRRTAATTPKRWAASAASLRGASTRARTRTCARSRWACRRASKPLFSSDLRLIPTRYEIL